MDQDKKEAHIKTLESQPAKLIDLANYQDCSLVSREIVNKKTGTVTVLVFDERQGLSEHTAPFDAVVYLLEGEVEIVFPDRPLRLKEGEIVIMPANQPHALNAIQKFKMMLNMIRF